MKRCLSILFIILCTSYKLPALEQDQLQRYLDYDCLYYLSEIANISLLNSKNKSAIVATSVASQLKNFIFGVQHLHNFFHDSTHFYKLSTDTHGISMNALKIGKCMLLLRSLLNLYSSIDSARFIVNDANILNNYKNLMTANAESSILDNNQKMQQTAWLTFNKLFPYIMLSLKRLFCDKVVLNEIFLGYQSPKTLEESILVFSFARLLINFSENIRRSLFYKKINTRIKKQKSIIKQNAL